MSLSNADLRDLVHTIDEAEGLFTATQDEVKEAVDELLALRARMVGGTDGPDQGDPAAWFIAHRDAPHRFWVTTDADSADACRVGDRYVVTDLIPRAPGAVAAAPPGDEDPATRAVLDLTYRAQDVHELSPGAEAVYRYLDAGWRLVPPAPPAGHEDEAAVERAAQAYAAFNYAVWDALDEETQSQYRDETRAVLAAARGPRTPDPGAGA